MAKGSQTSSKLRSILKRPSLEVLFSTSLARMYSFSFPVKF